MNYADSGAFRMALEARLRADSLRTGVPLVRLRKMVAFERFLARLATDAPARWVLKGGLALQWRLGLRARSTQDLDLLDTVAAQDAPEALVRAALMDLGDWFRYLVETPATVESRDGYRCLARALLDGRPFETFRIDVGWGDPVVEPAELLGAPSMLGFAGVEAVAVPCYPLTQQVAEKLHAYTRLHRSGQSSRTKDLVDILLIMRMGRMTASALRRAIQATFAARGSQALPSALPDPPRAWASPFGRLAAEVGLEIQDLDTGVESARRFLDPILDGTAEGAWDPEPGHWVG